MTLLSIFVFISSNHSQCLVALN